MDVKAADNLIQRSMIELDEKRTSKKHLNICDKETKEKINNSENKEKAKREEVLEKTKRS